MNNKAETLIEVIVAVSIIMIIAGPASSLLITSSRNTNIDRNDLIAEMLADEGIEMIRNFYNTNLLRFPSAASQCWNTKPSVVSLSSCASNVIAEGSYRLGFDSTTFRWLLEGPAPTTVRAALSDDLTDSRDSDYKLGINELATAGCVSPGDPVGCHTHFKDDTHMYVIGGQTASGFYRSIELSYLDLDSPVDGVADAMKVISKVLYKSGASVRTFKAATLLYKP